LRLSRREFGLDAGLAAAAALSLSVSPAGFVAERRDRKGLYRKARAGSLPHQPAQPATLPATALIAVPKSDSGAVRFAPGASDLGGDARSVLDSVAQKLSTQPNQQIQLVAYASAPGSDANGAVEARLTSLARAVVVRDYLIQRGVSGAQIKVRALGNRVEGAGSPDRVDLMILGS